MDRHRSARRCLAFLPLVVLAVVVTAVGEAAAGDYYGFVVYTWDEDPVAWDHEIFPVAKALGAGWIQAEGPLMLSESAHWGRLVPDPGADLSDPTSYDFERLDWVEAAVDSGLEVVLTLSPKRCQTANGAGHMNRVFGRSRARRDALVERPGGIAAASAKSVPAQTIPTTR